VTWETVDEQDLEDYLTAPERFDLERSLTIEGFVPRSEIDPGIASEKNMETARRRVNRGGKRHR
jgi:hypothetical protein